MYGFGVLVCVVGCLFGLGSFFGMMLGFRYFFVCCVLFVYNIKGFSLGGGGVASVEVGVVHGYVFSIVLVLALYVRVMSFV